MPASVASETYHSGIHNKEHPMKKVEAVQTASQLEQIDSLLSTRDPIYGDIWRFGLNSALRISDILALTTDMVKNLDEQRPTLQLREQKTNKEKTILLNRGALAVIQRRLKLHPKDEWLFQSASPKNRRDDPKPINRKSVARVLKDVGEKVNPYVHLSCHSMRKTRGKFLYTDHGYSIERVCAILNHSSPSVTMAYIGIVQTDIDDSYTEVVL